KASEPTARFTPSRIKMLPHRRILNLPFPSPTPQERINTDRVAGHGVDQLLRPRHPQNRHLDLTASNTGGRAPNVGKFVQITANYRNRPLNWPFLRKWPMIRPCRTLKTPLLPPTTR